MAIGGTVAQQVHISATVQISRLMTTVQRIVQFDGIFILIESFKKGPLSHTLIWLNFKTTNFM
jgi:hypothetical protein